MGQPVVHFEVMGTDGERLRDYYSRLFGWRIDAANPMGYGVVEREENLAPGGIGIGGGIGQAPPGYDGHVTFYVAVPDVEAALQQAVDLGGSRMMGPDPVPGMNIEIGLLQDPEGHVIGVIKVMSG